MSDPYVLIPDTHPERYARTSDARAATLEFLNRLLEPQANDRARSDVFTGVLAAVTQISWGTRGSVTREDLEAWWGKIGKFYFEQYEFEDKQR